MDREVPVATTLPQVATPRLARWAALGGLLLVACSGDPVARLPQRPPESPAVDCRRAAPPTRGVTEPGTVLCLGTPAVLPVVDSVGRRAVVEVAVTGFAEVSERELTRLEASGAAQDIDLNEVTVYTLTARAELVRASPGRPAGGIEPLGLADLVSEDGSAAINVIRRWNPRGCRARFFDTTDDPGARITSCAWFTVDRGDEVTAAAVGSDIAAYAPPDGRPLVWEARTPDAGAR